MTLEFVSKMPEIMDSTPRNNLLNTIDEFVNADGRIAVVHTSEQDDYASAVSLYYAMRSAARRSGYPITVHMRGDEVYLAKKKYDV